MLSPEQILKNYNEFTGYINKMSDQDERREKILVMLNQLEEILPYCPASSKKEYHNAFEGGLVQHCLNVFKNSLKLKVAYSFSNISYESLLIACFFHDFGKVVSIDQSGNLIPHYVHEQSQWHREKLGKLYTENPDEKFMCTRHRTLFLLQHFGIKLSYDEYTAIMLNDGFVVDENKSYCMKACPLAFIVMTADYYSSMKEKEDCVKEGW
jgi:hypothetical protein